MVSVKARIMVKSPQEPSANGGDANMIYLGLPAR
jgi:hypothetical protein